MVLERLAELDADRLFGCLVAQSAQALCCKVRCDLVTQQDSCCNEDANIKGGDDHHQWLRVLEAKELRRGVNLDGVKELDEQRGEEHAAQADARYQ